MAAITTKLIFGVSAPGANAMRVSRGRAEHDDDRETGFGQIAAWVADGMNGYTE